MATQRMRIIDLAGFGTGRTFRINVDCSHWRLYVTAPKADQTLNGTSLTAFVVGFDANTGEALAFLDCAPLFDGQGDPVPWNQIWSFSAGASGALNGKLVMYYTDPAI